MAATKNVRVTDRALVVELRDGRVVSIRWRGIRGWPKARRWRGSFRVYRQAKARRRSGRGVPLDTEPQTRPPSKISLSAPRRVGEKPANLALEPTATITTCGTIPALLAPRLTRGS